MNKNVTRRALGRGLSNLIPVESEEKGSDNDVVEVAVDAIVPNPFQPRTDFKEEEIDNLASSIKNQGLLQPLVVRKKISGYEIISGERRFRALKKLGRDKVPCIVRPKVTDREMLELALVENIQRENLNDIETAIAYQKLLLECNLSHDDLAKRVGKSRSAVSNILRLLKLPVSVQQMVRNGTISMGHARALLAVDSEEKLLELATRISSEQLTVRDIEAAVAVTKPPKKAAKAGGSAKSAATTQAIDADLAAMLDKVQYRLGTLVKVSHPQDAKGRIEIVYHGKDDLNRIIELLAG